MQEHPGPSDPSGRVPHRHVRGTHLKRYSCDCAKYCKQRRTVSSKTFQRHRPYRSTADEDLITYVDRLTGTPVIGRSQPTVIQHGVQAPPPNSSAAAARTSGMQVPGPTVPGKHAGTSTVDVEDEEPPDMPELLPVSDDEDEDDDEGNGNYGDKDDEETLSSESSEEETRFHTQRRQTASRSPALSRTSSVRSHGGGLSRAPSLQQTPPLGQPLMPPLPEHPEEPMDIDPEPSDPEPSSSSEEEEPEPEVGYTEGQGAPSRSHRAECRDGDAFVAALRTASLDKSGLPEDVLLRLRSPPHEIPELTPLERAAIRMYIARGDASEENYADNRAAFMELHPDDALPSYNQVKKLVANITGVSGLRTDMCEDSCVAYTGPFEDFLECPKCGKACYDPVEAARGREVARRTFLTFPLGPQLQAMWASPENARLMQHRRRETERIQAEIKATGGDIEALDDIYYGSDYLARVEHPDDTPEQRARKDIGPDDMTLMFSIDGAHLYANKGSDCWFFIWVLYDLPPTARYKKRYVLPAAVVGGPNKPKNIDSFLFPGLYHLAALQREGIQIWDAAERRQFRSNIFLLFTAADSPAMAYLNGLVGHNGAHGCRLYCGHRGRHKPGLPTYYPALRRYGPEDDGPPNLSARTPPSSQEDRMESYKKNLAIVRAARTKQAYMDARLETGIAKPSIFSGLPERRFLGVPGGFVLDLMHLIALNIPDLVMSLLRGTLSCDSATDSVNTWDWAIFANTTQEKKKLWKDHGKLVASCAQYLPGSFDRPPRNPAEKISSGYKAWEFLLYVYGLLPALLRPHLPQKFYQHFCLLVSGVRIVLQVRQPLTQLPRAHRCFIKYAEGIEEHYYKGRVDRLHFVRPSLHTLCHTVPESSRIGPGPLHSQWTLENYIGNITREIKQHITPYANVSERALRRCQVNALKAMMPAFADPEPAIPTTAIDIGHGYALLRAVDNVERDVTVPEGDAIRTFLRNNNVYLEDPDWVPIVRRWARAGIPTGQVARSTWKEGPREAKGKKPRRARMVKVRGDRFAEVFYYFQFHYNGADHALAMVAPFSAPDPAILAYSEHTVLACTHPGANVREVILLSDIVSVVAMIPLPMTTMEAAEEDAACKYGNRYFVVEKPGLDIAYIAGRIDDPDYDADGFQVD